MYKNIIKRIIDLIFAIVSLVVFSPIFVLACVAIKLDSRGPIFFQQRRLGKDKKEFKVIKFRSMVVNAPKERPTRMLRNPDEYVTKVGKVLRITSIDELPQLFNIIVGHMSVVGPRPVIPKEYELINKRVKGDVYSVRPGLTGWAQVNGRDEISIDTKVQLDSDYVENLSFLMDVKCIWRTIPLVFRADDAPSVEAERVGQLEEKI